MLQKRSTAKDAKVFRRVSQSFFSLRPSALKLVLSLSNGFCVSLRFYFIFIFLPHFSFCQTDSVAYSPGFHFREGIYLSYQQFRNNRPVPKSKIISSYDSTSIDFLKQVLSGKSFRYLDSANNLIELGTGKTWGYSENGSLYVYYLNDFNRVVVIGSICHFTALYASYVYNSVPGGMYSPTYDTPVQTVQQYILDTKTGNILDFNERNIGDILLRDPELSKEYFALGKGKRRQMMFIYLRKYNDKHPLMVKK